MRHQIKDYFEGNHGIWVGHAVGQIDIPIYNHFPARGQANATIAGENTTAENERQAGPARLVHGFWQAEHARARHFTYYKDCGC
jgi:hypothetical protein